MRRLIALPIAAVLALAGCATTTTPVDTVAPTALWDSTAVHSIELDFDQEAYATLLSDYIDGGEKTWMAATVTIDGTVIENVGLKLKGNSTLKGVNADSDAATLPWILRFDKYVDGQTYEGESELIVRGNVSSSSLNEAVALDLLGLAGLATEEAVSSRLSANGGASELRLIIHALQGGGRRRLHLPRRRARGLRGHLRHRGGGGGCGAARDVPRVPQCVG